jgi:glycosyltransferase involved in cell wall biosynthesis
VDIGLLHYSGPPTVGGVEQTLYYHARTLADLGHRPRLLVGQGQPFDDRVSVIVIPELYSKHPQVLEVKARLDEGRVTRAFESLREGLARQLREQVAGLEVLVAHNTLTLHKNLALTAALKDLLQADALPRLIGWHHDLAWDRPGYQAELHQGFPWDLLRRPWPGVTNVVVSEAQQQRLSCLYEVPPDTIDVIPPGVDPCVSGRWTDLTGRIATEFGLLRTDGLLLLPARITRRKNIEFGLQVLAALRHQTGQDIRLIVTGPPGPHNPANVAYLQELLCLRAALDLEGAAHFLYQLEPNHTLTVDDATMASLYSLCDALLFPSRDEGFGIPLLEAGIARLPVFCSDIPPLRESGGNQVHYFSLAADPQEIASTIAETLLADPPFTLRRRVLSRYTWDRIVTERLVPLLTEGDDD